MTVKITPDIAAVIVERHRAGLFQAAIGEEVGLSQTAVSRFLRTRGYREPSAPAASGHKRCYACTEEKPLADFWRSSESRDGLCGACKACMSTARSSNRSAMRYRARTVYGISLEQYDQMKAASPACPICGAEAELHLDHDEISGKVRAFVCGKCNRGLGLFGHDVERLLAAAEYLRSHQ